MSVTFKDNSAAVKAQFERNKAKCLEMLGLKWQENATKEATAQGAVDSGRYRASLSYVTPERESGLNNPVKESKDSDALSGGAIKDAVKVGTNLDYGVWIELGTAKYPYPRPIVQNSVQNYRDEYQEIIKDTLGEGFGVSGSITVSGTTKKGSFTKTTKI